MKRIWSLLLVFLMLISSGVAYAEETNVNETVKDIMAYLSVSKYGEIVKSKDEEAMAYVPVVLTGKESYTLDDLFSAAHALYYTDGSAGYASSEGEWGLGIDMFWGDTSYNFGYQVNKGSESVMGLTHEVENGDFVDACIYKNLYPDTEGYATFDMQNTEETVGNALCLTLTYVSGYDENWNTVFSPCEEAVITINGEETEFVTDENGEVEILLEETGTYVVSAKKTKMVNEVVVTAITAPVCVVKAKENPAIRMIHNIAKAYTQSNLEDAGGNLPWILADMAVYNELFPESEHKLTQEQTEKALELITSFAKEATRPGDLAKSILALKALGYDAKRIFTSDYQKTNVVEKLLHQVKEQDESVTNIYTLPYVIIALSQDESYTDEEQMQTLIQAAVANKDVWQNIEDGTDALTPFMLALAPFGSENEEIKSILEESVAILIGQQREDGLIDGFPGYESASTGLALCALSAVGVNAQEVVCGEKSLIDGLLSTENEESTGFSNAFATEQGFRGLLAWRLLIQEKQKAMYDFSAYPMEEVNFSGVEHCPVIFSCNPQSVSITVNGQTILANQVLDLTKGSYTYVAYAPGYYDKTDVITITEEDVKEHIAKNISVSLIQVYSGGGGGGGGTTTKKPEKEEVKKEEQIPEPEKEPEKETPEPVEPDFSDVTKEDWYYPAVCYVYEKKLFGGTDKGFEPEIPMTRGMLVTVLHRLESPEEENRKKTFSDVAENAWYEKGVAWAAETGIVEGVSESEFAPDAKITREQLATILYRYAKMKNPEISVGEELTEFEDIEAISYYAEDAMQFAVGAGIIGGKEPGVLAPKSFATRAEVATMLMRFAEVIK